VGRIVTPWATKLGCRSRWEDEAIRHGEDRGHEADADPGRQSLDRHATYILATVIAHHAERDGIRRTLPSAAPPDAGRNSTRLRAHARPEHGSEDASFPTFGLRTPVHASDVDDDA
jgi:hypothetical protein